MDQQNPAKITCEGIPPFLPHRLLSIRPLFFPCFPFPLPTPTAARRNTSRRQRRPKILLGLRLIGVFQVCRSRLHRCHGLNRVRFPPRPPFVLLDKISDSRRVVTVAVAVVEEGLPGRVGRERGWIGCVNRLRRWFGNVDAFIYASDKFVVLLRKTCSI